MAYVVHYVHGYNMTLNMVKAILGSFSALFSKLGHNLKKVTSKVSIKMPLGLL